MSDLRRFGGRRIVLRNAVKRWFVRGDRGHEQGRLPESGPAAGVVATRSLARRINAENLIAFDMGGTTAKASLIERGEAALATNYEVGPE
jgi:hypothetical protein